MNLKRGIWSVIIFLVYKALPFFDKIWAHHQKMVIITHVVCTAQFFDHRIQRHSIGQFPREIHGCLCGI